MGFLKLIEFFRQGTKESSFRLIFILAGISLIVGITYINIVFAINLTKFSGFEILQILLADTACLLTLIYGKNKAKELELNNIQKTNKEDVI